MAAGGGVCSHGAAAACTCPSRSSRRLWPVVRDPR